jgi:hypothetical protein
MKRGIAVAHRSSEDVHPHRLLELLLWMLDSAVYSEVRAAKPGSVNLESRRELKYVLHLAQSASGELATKAEYEYWLNAGGADVKVAALPVLCSALAAGMPSLEPQTSSSWAALSSDVQQKMVQLVAQPLRQHWVRCRVAGAAHEVDDE